MSGADQAEELSIALDQVTGDAAAIMLRGYRLPTDRQIIRPNSACETVSTTRSAADKQREWNRTAPLLSPEAGHFLDHWCLDKATN